MKDLCIFLGHSGIAGKALFRGGASQVGVSGIAWALKLVCFCGFANFLITVLYDRFDLSGARYWN
jgi:hypothetical protein